MSIIINGVSVNESNVSSLEAFIEWYMSNVDADYDFENDEDYEILNEWCSQNDHYLDKDTEQVVNLIVKDEKLFYDDVSSFIDLAICNLDDGMMGWDNDFDDDDDDDDDEDDDEEEEEEKVEEKVEENLKDEFVIAQSNRATEIMIGSKIPIDDVCHFIKNYHKEYFAIKKESPSLARHYTFEKWVEHISTLELISTLRLRG